MTEITEGARVRIRDPERYIHAVKRLGDRIGTVERIFTPHGASRPLVRVAFDHKRGKQPIEFFELGDLVAVTDLLAPHNKE